jgi:hypothetical protein
MNGRMIRRRHLLMTFIMLACIPALAGLYPIGVAAALKPFPQQISHHFSPVINEEKTLSEKFNDYRQREHLGLMGDDWDLFRFARLEAKKMAAGEIHAVDNKELSRLLSGIGRSNMRVQSLIVPATSAKQFSDPAWWVKPEIQRFVTKNSGTLLGTGHAKGTVGEFWIILTAQELK